MPPPPLIICLIIDLPSIFSFFHCFRDTLSLFAPLIFSATDVIDYFLNTVIHLMVAFIDAACLSFSIFLTHATPFRRCALISYYFDIFTRRQKASRVAVHKCGNAITPHTPLISFFSFFFMPRHACLI